MWLDGAGRIVRCDGVSETGAGEDGRVSETGRTMLSSFRSASAGRV
jgi:hypothetical protein